VRRSTPAVKDLRAIGELEFDVDMHVLGELADQSTEIISRDAVALGFRPRRAVAVDDHIKLTVKHFPFKFGDATSVARSDSARPTAAQTKLGEEARPTHGPPNVPPVSSGRIRKPRGRGSDERARSTPPRVTGRTVQVSTDEARPSVFNACWAAPVEGLTAL
jgi:hypothetical protein